MLGPKTWDYAEADDCLSEREKKLNTPPASAERDALNSAGKINVTQCLSIHSMGNLSSQVLRN